MSQLDALQEQALLYWPPEILSQEKSISILPRLIETQDKFISLLHLSDRAPDAWEQSLRSTNLSPNLFLKHLIVLSNIGGEQLGRLKKTLDDARTSSFTFLWNGKEYTHSFASQAHSQPWTNVNLKVDGKHMLESCPLTEAMSDVIYVLLFAGFSVDVEFPPFVTENAIIGGMIGNKRALDTFVRQRYIMVSRITGGATANSLGNFAQKYVKDFFERQLPDWDFSQKTLPHNANTPESHVSFDIIAHSPHGKYCAIEVSFQVTTNSTIERKAGQAQSRQQWVHASGHNIMYVVDGAGNFERKNAILTIFSYCDHMANFSETSLNVAVDFLKGLDQNVS